MEVMQIIDLGMENGVKRKKITFTNPTNVNTMAIAQSHFTKEQKKTAKLNNKLNK